MIGLASYAIRQDHVRKCSLYDSGSSRVFHGSGRVGVGLGTVDQAAAPIMDDPIDLVLHRNYARVGLGALGAMDDRLC